MKAAIVARTIRNVFVNHTEGRARMVFRLLGQALLLFLFIIPASVVLSILYVAQVGAGGLAAFTQEAIAQFVGGHPLVAALYALMSLVAFLGSIGIAARFLDRRPLADFGLRFGAAWWRDLGFGLALGAFLMLLTFLVELACGWITVTDTFYVAGGGPFGLMILAPLVQFLAVGIYEELFSLGYHMTNFAQGFRNLLGRRGGLIAGWVLSSLIFGLMHGMNPHATSLSTVNIALSGMFLLGVGYLLTGRLAIPIGVHITWNFFQGNVFGFPVSGTSANNVTFIAVEQGGADLLTGGAFGPEAGLLGLAAMFLGAALTVLWVRWREGRVELYLPMTAPRDPGGTT